MKRELQRVDGMLRDRGSIPWRKAPEDLEQRIHQRLDAASRPARFRLPLMRLGLAAVITMAAGSAVLFLRSNHPAPTPVAAAPDPSRLIPPALRLISTSMDEPLVNEAKQLLDDTTRITRRVVAQLPLAGRGS